MPTRGPAPLSPRLSAGSSAFAVDVDLPAAVVVAFSRRGLTCEGDDLLSVVARIRSAMNPPPAGDGREALAGLVDAEADAAFMALLRDTIAAPSNRRRRLQVAVAILPDVRTVLWYCLQRSRDLGAIFGSPSLADWVREATQELCIHLLDEEARELRRFRGTTRDAWMAFLSRVTRNHLLNLAGRQRLEGRIFSPLPATAEMEGPWREGVVIHRTPEAEVIDREQLDRVLAALQEMVQAGGHGARNAEIIGEILSGASAGEVALDPRLGVTRGTVRRVWCAFRDEWTSRFGSEGLPR